MEVWQYGIKETTSIQTDRTGGDAEQAGPTLMHMWWIKIQEGCFGSEESQPYTRLPSQEFQCQEDKSHNFCLQKPVGIELVEEIIEVPSNSP